MDNSFRRLARFSLIRPAVWDKYKYLRGVAALLMVVCTLGAGIEVYDLWRGRPLDPYRAFVLPLGALVLLVAVPKKYDLIVQTLGAYFIFSIIGTLLGRGGLRLGLELELVGVTGVAFFVAIYVGAKLGLAQTKFGLGQQPTKGRTVPSQAADARGEPRSDR